MSATSQGNRPCESRCPIPELAPGGARWLRTSFLERSGGALRPHAAYFLAVHSCSSRHSSKSARVRLETNTAHGVENVVRAFSNVKARAFRACGPRHHRRSEPLFQRCIRRDVIHRSRSAIAMGEHRRNNSASFRGGHRDGDESGHGPMKAPRDAAGQLSMYRDRIAVGLLGVVVWTGLLFAVNLTWVCTCPTGAFDPNRNYPGRPTGLSHFSRPATFFHGSRAGIGVYRDAATA